MINFYNGFIKKGDLCFDIGANIGERTDIFLKLGAKVIAIEPQSSCCVLLNKKYQDNKNVKILQCAVGSNEREDEIMICDETNECSTLSNDFMTAYSIISGLHWKASEKIKVTTLESVIQHCGIPALCKIDIEGYESEALLGLKSPIRLISFEFNYALLADTVKSLEILTLLGNYHCNFIKYETMNLVLKEWLPAKEFHQNISQIIPSDILTGEIVAKCLS